jgi:hypothetical protein
MIAHPNYCVTDTELKDHFIENLTTLFYKFGSNIHDFNLPRRTSNSSGCQSNHFIDEELCDDIDNLLSDSQTMIFQLNNEQLQTFDTIIEVVLTNKSGFFFVSGYGGTGTTFLWNTIIAYLRAQKRIVLSVASSGIASLLLPKGRTTHSKFKIPTDLDDTSVCDIKKGTMLIELIQPSSLLIWDEALMTNMIAFEALDRTLQDLLSTYSPQNKK